MITLVPLDDLFTIYQVSDFKSVPSEIYNAGFFSVTSTGDEISVVTNCKTIFPELKANEGWKCFRVEGILDFSLVGIINEITRPLKDSKISVFVISTFNTDYLFVKEESFLRAIEILKMTDNIKVEAQNLSAVD